jgi:hypothetical protein
MAEFYGKRATPLGIIPRAFGTYIGTGTVSYCQSDFSIGPEHPHRWVVVMAMSADSNSPYPTSCTVSGLATSRVTFRNSPNALAIFITNAPVPTGASVTSRVVWSGASVSNRVITTWTLEGNLNPTPIDAKSLNAFGSNTIAVRPGGIVLAAHTLRNDTTGLSIGGMTLYEQGTVASSHRWGWSYQQCHAATDTYAISQNPGGGVSVASWALY